MVGACGKMNCVVANRIRRAFHQEQIELGGVPNHVPGLTGVALGPCGLFGEPWVP